jgi:hypothetical protein
MVGALSERQLRFRRALSGLERAEIVSVAPSCHLADDPEKPGAEVQIGLATQASGGPLMTSIRGARLYCVHWRLICDGTQKVNSFEHGMPYGLPAPIDAIGKLRDTLIGARVRSVTVDEETGDLMFDFVQASSLVVLNLLTGYETWELELGGNLGEYSNHVLEP